MSQSWKYISANLNIEKRSSSTFCFDSSNFSFKRIKYIQKDGSATGNPASPRFANTYRNMNELVISILRNLLYTIPFIKIYVDDTILAIQVLQFFIQFNNKLKFVLEHEQNQKISFLDIELTRQENGQLLTNSSYSHSPPIQQKWRSLRD